MYRNITCAFAVAVLVQCSAGSGQAAHITNGDFSGGLTGWTDTGPVSDGGGFALLEEDPVFSVTSLEQEFIIPSSPKSLSFDFLLSTTSDGTSGLPFPDAFTASLLDPVTFNPLLSTPGFTDFFYADRAGFMDFDSSIVGEASGTVTLDISSLASGIDALLAFDLLGGDDGFDTTVQIDNVQVQAGMTPQQDGVVPEPTAMLVWAGVLGCFACGATLRRRRQHS